MADNQNPFEYYETRIKYCYARNIPNVLHEMTKILSAMRVRSILPCFKIRPPRSPWAIFGILRVVIGAIFIIITVWIMGKLIFNRKTFLRDLGYYVRPIWGSPARKGPEKLIPHLYSDLVTPKNRCHLHGWSPRVETLPIVVDAVIFSVELDILEVRLKELWNVVDIFIIVEASTTFKGNSKPFYYLENKHRFEWASSKIRYFQVTSLSSHPTQLFENESDMRNSLTNFIKSLGLSKGDLVIASDVDEIPSEKAISLVKNCQGYPRELHLLVDEYLYSFEFPTGTTNWRPHVTQYDPETFQYHHIILKDTKLLLADAGWHCSFCFRYLSEFKFKMTSYSHAVSDNEYLDPDKIQGRICDGTDIFEMPPEAYSFRDFISRWGPMRKKYGTVDIPASVVESAEKYKWLLPGGCIREDHKSFQNNLSSDKNV